MGMLNALGHFFVPALSPAMFNVATIACIVLLVPLCRGLGVEPVTAVARGDAGRGLGQVLIQLPPLRREGFATGRFGAAIRACARSCC